MKIKVVGSAIDGNSGRQFAASYLVDRTVAIDAGSVGMISSVDEQREIKHIFISHCHIDHIATLPMFLDNVYALGPDCPTIYGNEFLRDSLLRDVFNERLWPDLIRLSHEESPFLKFRLLDSGDTTQVGSLSITSIELNHVVPTLGFIIEDAESAVAIISDTSPTEAIWTAAAKQPKLKAVFLESAFPNSMTWLADKAGHLTPEMFRQEYSKLGRDVPVIAVHIKPAFFEEVVGDLQALNLSQLTISKPNTSYEF